MYNIGRFQFTILFMLVFYCPKGRKPTDDLSGLKLAIRGMFTPASLLARSLHSRTTPPYLTGSLEQSGLGWLSRLLSDPLPAPLRDELGSLLFSSTRDDGGRRIEFVKVSPQLSGLSHSLRLGFLVRVRLLYEGHSEIIDTPLAFSTLGEVKSSARSKVKREDCTGRKREKVGQLCPSTETRAI